MSNRQAGRVAAALFALTVAVWAFPAPAQTNEVNEKPPMYSYVGFWTIPRAQWGEMEKAGAADQKILDKAMSSGTIVAYGHDMNLVHSAEGPTHDDWWSSMSLAGMLNVLDQFYKSGNSTAPVLSSSTRHWDSVMVSRYYNWHSGSWKDLYTHGSSYKLKADAPNDAIDSISKTILVPMMEKMLAEGAIHEYEIDTESIHTESPQTFWLFYLAADAGALDKVNAAVRDWVKTNPMGGQAFGSMVDFSEHRDFLARTSATYK